MKSLMQRFWDKVIKSAGCWIWSAGTSSGYGSFRYQGQACTAHRVSWELANAARVPSGQVVLQSCGATLCVNPAHLFLAPLRSSARNPASDPVPRFWAKVIKSVGCWDWIGSTNNMGYGQFYVTPGRSVLAHRFSWELQASALLLGECVLHECDHPACVRPDHLFVGSKADNTKDMVSKGRDRFFGLPSKARL